MSETAPTRTLHRDFFQRAATCGDAAALRDDTCTINYRDLAAKVSQVSDQLMARSVGSGDRVGLFAERSIDGVTATLAILRAGAAVVPLPPAYPTERLQTIAGIAALKYVVASADLARTSSLPATLALEDLLAPKEAERQPAPEIAPSQPAFVLSSSGSTGQPKLIVRSHQSFYHRLTWTWEQLPFDAEEVCVQKAHATTTHAVYELFEPLLAGIPTLILDDAAARDLEQFWARLEEARVSRLLMVPSAMTASLSLPKFRPPDLKVLVLMGERIDEGLAQRLVEAFPASTRLYSIYGSTEASSALVTDLRREAPDGLGAPITPEVEASVLNDDGEPVPDGEPGRLFLGGPMLFDGYLGEPERTREVLVEFGSDPRRWYDTRDRVRRVESRIEFLGRVDQTVKIRGFRVDLGEVESVLQDAAEVELAAVVADGDAAAAQRLIAFVTPATVDSDRLYAHLRDRLPEHAVPAVVVPLESLPLTASAKIDRRRLLADFRDVGNVDTFEAESPTEARVAEIWGQVLGHRRFGPEQSFFEAGGTSLSAFSLLAGLRDIADRPDKLTLETLYRATTLRAQAQWLNTGEHPESDTSPALILLRRPERAGTAAPLYLLHTPGGTLGAYDRFVQALSAPSEIVGVRDPYLTGERDPSEDFSRWIAHYVQAIAERQGARPCFIGGYSSAGAFAIEVAQRLQRQGQKVIGLLLIDTLSLGRATSPFAGWALRGAYQRGPLPKAIAALGRLRSPLLRMTGAAAARSEPAEVTIGETHYRKVRESAVANREHLGVISALFELNTELPFAMEESEFGGTQNDQSDAYQAFEARVLSIAPDFDPDTLRRTVIQYSLQLYAHQRYPLNQYEGPALLVEPRTRYSGLVHALLQPYFPELKHQVLPLGPLDRRAADITARFYAIAPHYLSMRDPVFTAALGQAADAFFLS